MNRSADWLHQAVEKALKGLHLAHGQQARGHGLGRSWRDLPSAAAIDGLSGSGAGTEWLEAYGLGERAGFQARGGACRSARCEFTAC